MVRSMSAAPVTSAAEMGESPVRHALRRLSVYLRRNGVYYTGWTILTLFYVAAFVAVPILVGWAHPTRIGTATKAAT